MCILLVTIVFSSTQTNVYNRSAHSNLEEGCVAARSHTYAIKSPLVTMACPKFAPKSTPSHGPIPKPHYLPHPWTHPTYDGKQHLDPICRWTYRPTDRPWESLITIGRCSPTRPNNNVGVISVYCEESKIHEVS